MPVPSFYFVQFLYSTKKSQNVWCSKVKQKKRLRLSGRFDSPDPNFCKIQAGCLLWISQNKQNKAVLLYFFARNTFVLHEFLMRDSKRGVCPLPWWRLLPASDRGPSQSFPTLHPSIFVSSSSLAVRLTWVALGRLSSSWYQRPWKEEGEEEEEDNRDDSRGRSHREMRCPLSVWGDCSVLIKLDNLFRNNSRILFLFSFFRFSFIFCLLWSEALLNSLLHCQYEELGQ